jgi:hypothetical protein
MQIGVKRHDAVCHTRRTHAKDAKGAKDTKKIYRQGAKIAKRAIAV